VTRASLTACLLRALAGALLAAVVLASVWEPVRAQTVPPERLYVEAWRQAGYDGVIPNPVGVSVKAFGARGDGAADDTAAVRRAIEWVSASPFVGMVYFPAGTYRLTATIALPDGIVLRGQRGAAGNLATLRFDLGGGDTHAILIAGRPGGPFQPVREQEALAAWLEVEDASAFRPGDHAQLQQANDPAWDAGIDWARNAVGQIVRIADVRGNRLFLEQGLRADYPERNAPQIRRLEVVRHVGLDHLVIERADTAEPAGGSIVRLAFAADSWIRGCELRRCVGRHVDIRSSTRIEVTGNVMDDAFGHGGGGRGYGVELSFHSGECLVQDNIFRRLRHAMLLQVGPNGNVLGYNYAREALRTEWPTTFASDISLHGNRPYANLFEGNAVGLAWFDGSHGPSAGPGNTLFRNAITGHGLVFTPTSPTTSGQNLVGNDVSMAVVFGADHFEHGNRVGRGGAFALRPPGSGALPDVSYYLAPDPLEPVTPPWWTVSDRIPTMGPGATVAWGDSRNPARARWDAGGTLTVGTSDPLQLTGEGPHASPAPPRAPAGSFVYLPSVRASGRDLLTVPGENAPSAHPPDE